MSDRQIPEEAKVLMQAKALISDKANWWGYGGAPALHDDGRWDWDDGRWCAVEAVMHVAAVLRTPNLPFCERLHRAALELGHASLQNANDHYGHKAVMAIYDRAIATAIEEAKAAK